MISCKINTIGVPVSWTLLICAISLFVLQSCNRVEHRSNAAQDSIPLVSIPDSLPLPYETKSVKNFSKVVGWPENKTPTAPAGFKVTKFADGLQNPRWIYVTPNGDVLVAEANAETKGIKKVTDKISGKAESQNTGTPIVFIFMIS